MKKNQYSNGYPWRSGLVALCIIGLLVVVFLDAFKPSVQQSIAAPANTPKMTVMTKGPGYHPKAQVVEKMSTNVVSVATTETNIATQRVERITFRVKPQLGVSKQQEGKQ